MQKVNQVETKVKVILRMAAVAVATKKIAKAALLIVQPAVAAVAKKIAKAALLIVQPAVAKKIAVRQMML
jgi:hypothetical protein